MRSNRAVKRNRIVTLSVDSLGVKRSPEIIPLSAALKFLNTCYVVYLSFHWLDVILEFVTNKALTSTWKWLLLISTRTLMLFWNESSKQHEISLIYACCFKKNNCVRLESLMCRCLTVAIKRWWGQIEVALYCSTDSQRWTKCHDVRPAIILLDADTPVIISQGYNYFYFIFMLLRAKIWETTDQIRAVFV